MSSFLFRGTRNFEKAKKKREKVPVFLSRPICHQATFLLLVLIMKWLSFHTLSCYMVLQSSRETKPKKMDQESLSQFHVNFSQVIVSGKAFTSGERHLTHVRWRGVTVLYQKVFQVADSRSYGAQCCFMHTSLFFPFQLLPSRLASVNHSSPSDLVFCILFSDTN